MTTNFKQEEFKCKCGCGEMRIAETIVMLCQMIRSHFNQPVTIVSGCRCLKHNTNVGGASSSMHMPKSYDNQCHAVDIQVKGIEPDEVYEFMEDMFPDMLGLGLYNSWVHIDDRLDRKYRWDKRN